MDDGKRAAASAKFMELLPTRKDVGNTTFRANVMFFLQEEFGCSVAAAATHYNHAKHLCSQTNPELLLALTGGAAGDVPALGRPAEKNNGGRKKKAVVETAEGEGTAENDNATGAAENVDTDKKLYNVIKSKDKSLVLFGVSLEDAEAAVAKAAAGKKAKLEIQ